jgi:hypothetical protein
VNAVALKHCEKYPTHTYEVHPRKDKRGFDLISDALPFGRLWYDGPNPTCDVEAKDLGTPSLFSCRK